MPALAEPPPTVLTGTLSDRDSAPKLPPSPSDIFLLAEHSTNKYYIQLRDKVYEVEIWNGYPSWWIDDIARRLEELSTLREDWDSYGALPVTQSSLSMALHLALGCFVRQGVTVFPRIGATPEGGLVFEWHDRSKDLELEIHPGSNITGYFHNEESGDDWEGNISTSCEEVDQYLDLLAKGGRIG